MRIPFFGVGRAVACRIERRFNSGFLRGRPDLAPESGPVIGLLDVSLPGAAAVQVAGVDNGQMRHEFATIGWLSPAYLRSLPSRIDL